MREDISIEMRISHLCLWLPERKAQGAPQPSPLQDPLHPHPSPGLQRTRMDVAGTLDGSQIRKAAESEWKLWLNSALLS